MRVLLVEDSRRLREVVSCGLRRAGYAVDTAEDGEQGLSQARAHQYDAMVLDLMLPRLDGLALLQTIRGEGNLVPVLILTARDTVDDRVRGLRTGADDYLIKPFEFIELLARIEALTRRQHGVKWSKISIRNLVLDRGARTVHRDGQVVELAPREYALLEFLALRQGEVVSRTEIEAHLYDDRADLLSNVVDAAVYALRRKIDAPDAPSLIQTRRGMGYCLGGETP